MIKKIKEIGDISISIIVGLDSKTEKILEYNICIHRCVAIKTRNLPNGKTFEFHEMESVLFRKILKKEAEKLMSMGYEKTAAYLIDTP